MRWYQSRLLALLAAFAVAIFIFARWISWNRLRPAIAWASERFTGMRVDIKGDLDVVPRGALGIDVENLAVSDRRDGVPRAPFFEIDRLGATWNLPSLRQRRIVLSEIDWGRAILHVDRFAKAAAKAATGAQGEPAKVEGWHVGWSRTRLAELDLRKNDRSIARLTGSIGGDLNLVPFAFEGDVEVHGERLARTLEAFGYGMADEIERYDAKGRLHLTLDALKVERLDARIARSKVQGDLAVAFTKPLEIEGSLHFSDLWFDDLGAFLPKKVQAELPATRIRQASPSLYSRAEIATAWLDGVKLALDAQVDRFVGEGKASLIESFDLKVELGDGTCRVAVPRSSVMGGQIEASLSVSRLPTAGIDAILKGRALGITTGKVFQELIGSKALAKKRIGRLAADELIEGTMDAFVDVRGQGVSFGDVMAGLDGEAGIDIGNGKISSLVVEVLGLDVTEAIGVLLAKNQQVGMQCAIAQAEIADGKLKLDPAFVSTKDSDLVAKGELDLSTEEVKLDLRTYPKDPSLGSLRTPIEIRGQLIAPRVSLDKKELAGRIVAGIVLGLITPAAALLATIEPGNAPERSCESYRAKLRSLPAAASSVAKPLQNAKRT